MKNTGNSDKDLELVKRAKEGSMAALESIIKNNQDWIYNLAVKMTGSPEDAQDITQEILIKLITKLSAFKNQSSLKTWLYRIAVNHILNMKKSTWERMFCSFEKHEHFKKNLDELAVITPIVDMPDEQLIIEETRSMCLSGMLLCLDRTQRMVFILGAVFRIDSKSGGLIMEMSSDNFRQTLSRARKQLGNFMNEKCGLINEKNTCRCSGKTKALIQAGLIDPGHLIFNRESKLKVEKIMKHNNQLIERIIERKVTDLFQNEPLLQAPEMINKISSILKSKSLSSIINFN